MRNKSPHSENMYNFFIEEENKHDGFCYIDGADFNHIKNVLRMKEGDTLLVSCNAKSSLCEITSFLDETVEVKIVEDDFQNTDLPNEIYLFQGLPKSDKMELIIQKAVELGVSKIIPTQMNRCVVKLDEKKKKAKQGRWQAISESAAKQSKRSAIPEVAPVLSFSEALEAAKDLDLFLVPYESKNGMQSTKDALSKLCSSKRIGILIGPEGGFEESEIEKAVEYGGEIISLGKRILRTETAAIASLAMCMLYIEINSSGDEE